MLLQEPGAAGVAAWWARPAACWSNDELLLSPNCFFTNCVLCMLLQEPGAAGVAAWWARPAACWNNDELLLAAGAVVVARLRAAVAQQLGYSCSAGIAHSKILAKLGSGEGCCDAVKHWAIHCGAPRRLHVWKGRCRRCCVLHTLMQSCSQTSPLPSASLLHSLHSVRSMAFCQCGDILQA